ncbi:winged helix-turn-helix domain-containing protein [Enterobacter sp.]|uniref:winged helix-turn-helix domain-containing protein n=1 Tax=Enterobacter sp. TaxID=42895 RepID=UPI0031D53C00
MHNHYLINGVIEFHPAASTLRNLNNPGQVVVLNSPAGRCFLLLIQRIGTIVTQQEFMESVWEKSGMLVSPNTFYQNISILRKGLKKIGLTEDSVVTIPRIGLTLASGIQIEKLNSEKLVEVSHEHAHFMDENSLAHELGSQPHSQENDRHDDVTPTRDIPPPAEIRPYDAAAQAETGDEPVAAPAEKPFRLSRMALWGAGVAVTLALSMGVALNVFHDDENQYFSSYRFLKTANGCHIFMADTNPTREEKTSALSLSERFKTACAGYPWVYVTHYSMLPRVSVIRCNKPMNEPNICISHYFYKDQ